jgi:hypothetical protein
MTPVPRLPLQHNPFIQLHEQFHTETGVKEDNPSYHTLSLEWISKNFNHVAAPPADHNV